jgi:hypothetical protein
MGEVDKLSTEKRGAEHRGFYESPSFYPKRIYDTVSRTFELFCFLNERSNLVGISVYVGTIIVIGNFLQSQTFSYKYTI